MIIKQGSRFRVHGLSAIARIILIFLFSVNLAFAGPSIQRGRDFDPGTPGAIGETVPHTGAFTQVIVGTDSNPLIDLNPSGTGTTEVIQTTPVNALIGDNVDWCGMTIDGAALDPGGIDNLICGFCVDFSGTDETNSPSINALCLNVPVNSSALFIKNGDIRHDYATLTDAGADWLAYQVVADGTNLDASSSAYMFDVSVTGGIPAGNVCALRTRSNVCPIRQAIGSFTSASQTEYAGRKTGGGVTWADGIDSNEIFVQNSDAIYIGSTSQFSRIQVVLASNATRSILPTFFYNTGADTWTEFFPSDATNGFQVSGSLAITLADISAAWTNDGDPGGADSSTGYWIKIIRTVGPDPGTPTPTTMKTGLITPYIWDKDGNLLIKDITMQGMLSTAPSAITAAPVLYANDATIAVSHSIVRIAGNGAAIILDTDPAIADGESDGQILYIQGCSDTDTVQIADACNTQLAGGAAVILGLGDIFTALWDSGGSLWREISRSNN